jgi:glycosyltransferase involved in cell wall biosynthesis
LVLCGISDSKAAKEIVLKTLYICYFGVSEPLVQTQVIPYLLELKKDGTGVILLTFEPKLTAGPAADAIRAELAEKGIDWRWLRYHKRPSAVATAWDIFQGALFVRRIIIRERPDILHGRVHVPTLMGALARKFTKHKPKVLFDIRGFFPEEYTDAGVWPEGGWLYRAAKRVERWLLKEADGFVVLTEKARDILFPGSERDGVDLLGRPVEVIPCCIGSSRSEFSHADARGEIRDRLGIGERTVITHVGALGGLYLTKEIVELLAASKADDASTFGLILTQVDPGPIIEMLSAHGFNEGDYFVGRVSPDDVPRFLTASDIALSLVKASYSTQSRSPTKIAEYLACGLPIIANRGVGDVDALINDNGVGVLLEEFSPEGYATALRNVRALGDIGERCRSVAKREFDLETVGGKRYRNIYHRLADKRKNGQQ